jgi:hypothetical protein
MSWKVISTITHLSTDATYSDFRASKRIDHLTVNAAKHVHVDCHLTVFFTVNGGDVPHLIYLIIIAPNGLIMYRNTEVVTILHKRLKQHKVQRFSRDLF